MLPEQNTPEWQQWRKSRIGASDLPIIMGVSPYSTPYELFQQKLDLAPSQEVNYAMQRGHDLEDQARETLSELLDVPLLPRVVIHPKYDWAIASLDGMDIEEKIIVEIKCPGTRNHTLAQMGHIPEHYLPQVQWQLFVTGLEKAYYFSYREESCYIVQVHRDDSYIALLYEKALLFHESLINKIPPPLTEKDYVDMSDNVYFVDIAKQWLDINEKIESLKQQEKQLKEALIEMGDDGNMKGAGIKVSRIERKGPIDYDAYLRFHQIQATEEELDAFRKPQIGFYKISRCK